MPSTVSRDPPPTDLEVAVHVLQPPDNYFGSDVPNDVMSDRTLEPTIDKLVELRLRRIKRLPCPRGFERRGERLHGECCFTTRQVRREPRPTARTSRPSHSCCRRQWHRPKL